MTQKKKVKKNKKAENKIKLLKNKTLKAILMLLIFSIIIYIIYTVMELIVTPTDTFIIENGIVSVEETATRSTSKRRNYS